MAYAFTVDNAAANPVISFNGSPASRTFTFAHSTDLIPSGAL